MIATVSVDSGHKCYSKPQPGCSNVGAHYQRSKNNGGQIGNEMLQRVCIYCHNANRGRPFMVDLVDEPVNTRMMEKPRKKKHDGQTTQSFLWCL